MPFRSDSVKRKSDTWSCPGSDCGHGGVTGAGRTADLCRSECPENLDLGAFLRTDRGGIRQDLDYVFTLFPILAKRRHQYGGTLSGGEQQMLAMSRALMARPQLLLLDEPSMGLAPLMIRQIFRIIKEINREHKTTIFLVEQNAHQALRIADRGYVIENGRIILTDRADRLLASPEVQKAYLGI